MNINDIKDFLQAKYPESGKVTLSPSCVRKVEINFQDGKLADSHHVEYDHVMIDIGDGQPVKQPIKYHRDIIKKADLAAFMDKLERL